MDSASRSLDEAERNPGKPVAEKDPAFRFAPCGLQVATACCYKPTMPTKLAGADQVERNVRSGFMWFLDHSLLRNTCYSVAPDSDSHTLHSSAFSWSKTNSSLKEPEEISVFNCEVNSFFSFSKVRLLGR